MSIALTGLMLTLLSFLIHVGLWRTRLPKRHTRALLVLFATVTLAGMAVLQRLDHPRLPHLPMDLLYTALLCASLAMAYIITYSALEAKSPTLTMIEMVASREGLEQEELYRALPDSALITPRFADLVRDGMATLDDGQYTITPKGRAFVSLFIFHRSLMGLKEKGG